MENRDIVLGTYEGETTYCPVNGWDCPYYSSGVCHIDDPWKECDDWIIWWPTIEEWKKA